jgi:NitT/TauT family transport system permease protein
VSARTLRFERAADSQRVVVTLRIVIVLAVLVCLQVLPLDRTVIPEPTSVIRQLVDLVPTAQFGQDLARTCIELGLSCVIGLPIGVAIGVLGWRYRSAGDGLEPYLVSLYAMPTLVFYPILLALLGLGSAPIVCLASVMVLVPVALNTTIGLRGISPVLIKLGRSLDAPRRQLLMKVLLPAAAPLVFPGIRLGVMYGLVGVIAMEFILADRGLGYRIGYEYNNFATNQMWAGIAVVVLLALAVMAVLGFAERRIRTELA